MGLFLARNNYLNLVGLFPYMLIIHLNTGIKNSSFCAKLFLGLVERCWLKHCKSCIDSKRSMLIFSVLVIILPRHSNQLVNWLSTPINWVIYVAIPTSLGLLLVSLLKASGWPILLSTETIFSCLKIQSSPTKSVMFPNKDLRINSAVDLTLQLSSVGSIHSKIPTLLGLPFLSLHKALYKPTRYPLSSLFYPYYFPMALLKSITFILHFHMYSLIAHDLPGFQIPYYPWWCCPKLHSPGLQMPKASIFLAFNLHIIHDNIA